MDDQDTTTRTPPPAPARESGTRRLLLRTLIVIVGAVIVAGLTYVLSSKVSATYKSSAKVEVQVSGTDANATTLGANNIAAQIAQQVSATQVLHNAGKQLHASIPSSAITAGTVSAVNVVSITATAGSAKLAHARAQAVAKAFTTYVSKQFKRQASRYAATAAQQIAPITKAIDQVRTELSKISSKSIQASGLQVQLTTLLAQRGTAQSQLALTAVSGRPSLSLIADAGGGSKSSPKPDLYAVVGFIVALLALTRLVMFIPMRRSKTTAPVESTT